MPVSFTPSPRTRVDRARGDVADSSDAVAPGFVLGPVPASTPSSWPASLTVEPTRTALGVLCVRCSGELDATTAPRLAATLRRCGRTLSAGWVGARAGGLRPRVVCDLSGIDFLGAAGLSVLVDAHRTLVTQGIELVVVAGRRASRPLRIMALDRVLTVWTASVPGAGSSGASRS